MDTLITFISEYFKPENRKDKFGNELYRTLGDYKFFYYMKEKLKMTGTLSSYAGYMCNDETKAIATFCEGDFYIKVHSDKESYEQDKEETQAWWIEA